MTSYRALYTKLYNENFSECDKFLKSVEAFPHVQEKVDYLVNMGMDKFLNYVRDNNENILQAYDEYVTDRKFNKERIMFKTFAQAKLYILAIAPTKLVDGAWLANCFMLEESPLKDILMSTYIDELGGYDKDTDVCHHNHVAIFKRLLESLYISLKFDVVESWTASSLILKDEYFIDGCIQMSLSSDLQHTAKAVGYNLGYEQMPLHLLISIYELEELGIDATYFSEHIGIDNPHCGHARQAIDAVYALFQTINDKDRDVVFREVVTGFVLSEITCAEDIANECTEENVVEHMFKEKAALSHALHNKVELSGFYFSDVMKQDIVSLASLMQENGYFSGDTLQDTKFYSLLRPGGVMNGTFTKDEIYFVEKWFGLQQQLSLNIEENLKTHQDRLLLEMFKRAKNKHKRIQMTHPDTAECMSMADWSDKSDIDFIKCCNSPEIKSLTKTSLLSGRMEKSPSITEDEKRFLLNWCNSN